MTCGGDHAEVGIVDERNRELHYSFDHAFDSSVDNAGVFEKLGRPLVSSVLCGYNGTLMAYGQTGSGKTHSLAAADGSGLINTMVGHLFQRIDETGDPELYRVSLSYIQVYNEKVIDLLHASSEERVLPLREDKEGHVYLEGVSEPQVRGITEVIELITLGRRRLHFAETRMNRHSSRSHAVCQLRVERTVRHAAEEGVGCGTGSSSDGEAAAKLALSQALGATLSNEVAVSARLTLVDLAGSERVKRTEATGTTLHEAQKINLSLLELGNVIEALGERGDGPPRHVPFRNSTLTRLLQESLGGNCKTSLLLCVSPARADSSETKGTLQFGSRAMRVQQEAVINAKANFEELAQQLARQLEDKEATWARHQQRLEAQMQAAVAALEQRDAAHAAALEQRDAASVRGLRDRIDALQRDCACYEAVLASEVHAVEAERTLACKELASASRATAEHMATAETHSRAARQATRVLTTAVREAEDAMELMAVQRDEAAAAAAAAAERVAELEGAMARAVQEAQLTAQASLRAWKAAHEAELSDRLTQQAQVIAALEAASQDTAAQRGRDAANVTALMGACEASEACVTTLCSAVGEAEREHTRSQRRWLWQRAGLAAMLQVHRSRSRWARQELTTAQLVTDAATASAQSLTAALESERTECTQARTAADEIGQQQTLLLAQLALLQQSSTAARRVASRLVSLATAGMRLSEVVAGTPNPSRHVQQAVGRWGASASEVKSELKPAAQGLSSGQILPFTESWHEATATPEMSQSSQSATGRRRGGYLSRLLGSSCCGMAAKDVVRVTPV